MEFASSPSGTSSRLRGLADLIITLHSASIFLPQHRGTLCACNRQQGPQDVGLQLPRTERHPDHQFVPPALSKGRSMKLMFFQPSWDSYRCLSSSVGIVRCTRRISSGTFRSVLRCEAECESASSPRRRPLLLLLLRD